jgi:hypothetical protein
MEEQVTPLAEHDQVVVPLGTSPLVRAVMDVQAQMTDVANLTPEPGATESSFA